MRVSDNTSKQAVHEALRKTRGRMEELQMKNATQKKILSPSEDPAANAKIMGVRTETALNSQFEMNGELAKNRLAFTEAALAELSEVFVRAKEIALSQSSEASASPESRYGVAQEVNSLFKQLVSIANRRVGAHYLFGGFKTQTSPYNEKGEYFGDAGEIPVEIQKGVFVTINVPGPEVFEIKKYKPLDQLRKVASEGKEDVPALETINLFSELDGLRVGLITNDTLTIRDSLERLDTAIEKTIALRTKLSSRVASINNATDITQKTDLNNAALSTRLEDADYTELWSNLAKEEAVLRSSLHAAEKLIQPTLLEFLR